MTSGFPCKATVFYNASPACGRIKFSLWLGLEDPEDRLVLEDQLLQRFVPQGCFSVQQAQCSVWSCGTKRSDFWLETSFCGWTILMPHHKEFFQGNVVSQLWCSQCEVCCRLQYQAETNAHLSFCTKLLVVSLQSPQDGSFHYLDYNMSCGCFPDRASVS